MKGEIYDKNFLRIDTPDDEKTDWYEVTRDTFDLYGSIEDGELLTLRMPREVAEEVNRGVRGQCVYGAGVRVRFSTDTASLSVKVEYGEGRTPSVCNYVLCWGFDIYRCEGCTERYVASFVPPSDSFNHESATYSKVINRNGGYFGYTLNFPHYASVKRLYIGIDKGSRLGSGDSYKNEKPIVFYGSSITHGACASNPGNTYENFISHMYNYDYVNLGFAGCAVGERRIAEYMSGLDMSVFVCDFDHNISSAKRLAECHYPLYEVIRKSNPDLPYIMISRPDFFANPTDSRERRAVILDSYNKARLTGDENVYFIDGEHIFDGEFYESCTVDGVHPNDLGFLRMSKVVGEVLHEILG